MSENTGCQRIENAARTNGKKKMPRMRSLVWLLLIFEDESEPGLANHIREKDIIMAVQ